MKSKSKRNQNSKKTIFLIKLILMYILFTSVVFEVILFPSLENFLGCIMAIVCYVVFVNFFLKRRIIINFPFAFMILLSMFMYRFIPLPATLLEGIPISYGMEVPISTFLLETVLFLVSSCAFYFATLNRSRNNLIQKIFKNIGFYRPTNRKTLWIIGVIGCLARIITFSLGNIAIGNVFGKILMPFINFMYIPVIIFFPSLYECKHEKTTNFNQPIIWIYLILISILNLGVNRREALIEPLGIIALLYIFNLLINNISVNKMISPKRLIPILLIFFISLNLLTIASDAILSIRNNRNELSFTELIETTFDRIVNSKTEDKNIFYKDKIDIAPYDKGWTETYLNNFILNRFANIRITDETLYLKERIIRADNTNLMFKDFVRRLILILPQPLIDRLGFDISKKDYRFSRGDVLYVYSGIGNSYNLGGDRVTSHLGDGLATFGKLYLPVQFIVFFIVFKLLNCYSYRNKDNTISYSIYGLFSIYTCLNIVRNANGMIGEVYFITREYWQKLVLFIIIFSFAHFISRIKMK